MLPNTLSADGRWVCYGIRTSTQDYSIIVQNTESDEKYILDHCYDYNFSENGGWFYALDLKNQLHYINLGNGKRYAVADVINYRFSPNSEFLAYLKKNAQEDVGSLYLKNLNSETMEMIPHVVDYAFSPNGGRVAIIQRNDGVSRLFTMDLHKRSKTEIGIWDEVIASLLWTPNNKGIAFIAKNRKGYNEMYWCYDVTNPGSTRAFGADLKQWEVAVDGWAPNIFSADSGRLFLHARPLSDTLATSKAESSHNGVQVWNTEDEFPNPAQRNIEEYWSQLPFTIVWDIQTEAWHVLGVEEAKMNIPGTGLDYAYSYSYKVHLLAADDREAPSSIFVSDLDTGKTKPVIEKPTGLEFKVSPSGRYLSYFKDGNWLLYDPKTDTHTNLTKDLKVSFSDSLSRDLPYTSYGNAGWTADEKEILLYDAYDIWAVSPNAKSHKRITHGREDGRRYRIYTLTDDIFESSKFDSSYFNTYFDLGEGVILSAYELDTGNSGYFKYSTKKGLVKIVFKDALISNLRLSKNGAAVVYSEERFDLPKRLIFKDLIENRTRMMYQSNPQHFQYKWGREELVSYKNKKGERLRGILYYPADFDPKKRYPMIVSIYELQSDKMFTYYNPSKYDPLGFNIPDFTANGYFVFLPDIINEIQNPGISALQCVEAGIESICELPYINKEKIGLHGHSFGGYEALFIITHTNFFATAIAGSGVSDLLSFTHSMAWLWNWPQYTRVESLQWRFGDTYFNIPEVYNRNSPINFAQHVKTPLLSWSGNEDSNVNWQQSVEFYLALRRLGKPHIMLLYGNEGHDLHKPDNQLDLSTKTMQWYNYYLKDCELPNWMKAVK